MANVKQQKIRLQDWIVSHYTSNGKNKCHLGSSGWI